MIMVLVCFFVVVISEPRKYQSVFHMCYLSQCGVGVREREKSSSLLALPLAFILNED